MDVWLIVEVGRLLVVKIAGDVTFWFDRCQSPIPPDLCALRDALEDFVLTPEYGKVQSFHFTFADKTLVAERERLA